MCENDTFNSKFEPGELILIVLGFCFSYQPWRLEDLKVTSDCVSYGATASGDQVGFNGQLFGKSVWCGGVAGAGGVLQCLTEQ